MKTTIVLFALSMSAISFAQTASTSFENPAIFSGNYTDTGDATTAHNLVNNPNEPLLNFISSGTEMGFNARYEPYDTPGVGLTDGDEVGVTDTPPSSSNPFLDGNQGYKVSDIDGNFILEFDVINLNIPNQSNVSIQYFISETGYEGDGTLNASGSDRLRIYVKDLTNNTEIDILDTTGSDINDLGIEGVWNTGDALLSPNTTVQLVIEARTNAGGEAFYFDNIQFNGLLGVPTISKNVFSIFPNPATNDVLQITSNNRDSLQVAIYNILGKEVLKHIVHNQKLNISALQDGVYILKITQNNSIATKKLIVKR